MNTRPEINQKNTLTSGGFDDASTSGAQGGTPSSAPAFEMIHDDDISTPDEPHDDGWIRKKILYSHPIFFFTLLTSDRGCCWLLLLGLVGCRNPKILIDPATAAARGGGRRWKGRQQLQLGEATRTMVGSTSRWWSSTKRLLPSSTYHGGGFLPWTAASTGVEEEGAGTQQQPRQEDHRSINEGKGGKERAPGRITGGERTTKATTTTTTTMAFAVLRSLSFFLSFFF